MEFDNPVEKVASDNGKSRRLLENGCCEIKLSLPLGLFPDIS